MKSNICRMVFLLVAVTLPVPHGSSQTPARKPAPQKRPTPATSAGPAPTQSPRPNAALARQYLEQGWAKRNACDYPAAIELFTQAVAEKIGWPIAHAARALACREAEVRMRAGDVDRAIDIEPDDAESFLARGIVRYLRFDYKGAAADLTKVIDRDPSNAPAHELRGIARGRLDDDQGALSDYGRAIDLSHSSRSYEFRAEFEKNSYDFRGAREDYTRAIEVSPTVYTYEGRARFNDINAHRYADALQDYNKAIELHPSAANYDRRAGVRHTLADKAGEERDRLMVADASEKEKKIALESITKAIQSSPNDPYNYLDRAQQKKDIKDYQGALEDCTRAIELRPDPENYQLRGDLKTNNLGDAQGGRKDYKTALDLVTKTIDENPGQAQGYLWRARLKALLGDSQGASQDNAKAAEVRAAADNMARSPDASFYNDQARFKRGFGSDLKDYEGALADYSRAIELRPTAKLYADRASLRRDDLKDFRGALEDLNRALELRPKSVEYYRQRAELKAAGHYLNDPSGAIEDYSKLIDLFPVARDYTSRAKLLAKLGDSEGALRDYVSAVELDAHSVSEYDIERVGERDHEEQGNYLRRIVANLTRVIERLPKTQSLSRKTASLYCQRAKDRHHLDDDNGALQDFAKAIELSPTAEVYLSRAKFMDEEMKDQAGALRDYTKAIELEPKNVEHYKARAKFQVRRGETEVALQDYGRVLEIDPNDWEALFARAELREKRGDLNGAVQDYSKLISLHDAGNSWFYVGYAYFGRAKLRQEKGDTKGALEDAAKALQNEPKGLHREVEPFVAELRRKSGQQSTGLQGGGQNKTIVVAQDGTGDYTTLDGALKEAQAGDIIQIRPGTYYPDANVKDGMTIVGVGNDPSKVVVGWLHFVGSPKRIKIQSLTIANVGLEFYDASDVTLENLRITHHRDEHPTYTMRGGLGLYSGVYIKRSKNILVKTCRISGFIEGTLVDEGSTGVKLERNLISENEKGIWIRGGAQVTAEGNTLVRNTFLEPQMHFSGNFFGAGVLVQGNKTEVALYNNIIAFNDLGVAVSGKYIKEHSDVERAALNPKTFNFKDADLPSYRLEYNNSYGNTADPSGAKWADAWAYDGQDGKDYVIITQHRFAGMSYDTVFAIGGKPCCLLDLVSQAVSANTNMSVNPMFVDEMKGDYHLRPGSPLATKGMGGTYMGAMPPVGGDFK